MPEHHEPGKCERCGRLTYALTNWTSWGMLCPPCEYGAGYNAAQMLSLSNLTPQDIRGFPAVYQQGYRAAEAEDADRCHECGYYRRNLTAVTRLFKFDTGDRDERRAARQAGQRPGVDTGDRDERLLCPPCLYREGWDDWEGRSEDGESDRVVLITPYADGQAAAFRHRMGQFFDGGQS